MLSHTSSLVVATGIANIWARDAVASSGAAKTLTAAYDERFVLGLGVSHKPLVSGMRGHDYDSPYQAMAGYLAAMDRATMLAEEGSTRVARVIAALGPKMLDLAATQTDGAHPYLVTPEHTALARTHLGEKFLGVEQAVVVGGDREEYLRRAHEHLEFYTGLPNYRNNWRRLDLATTTWCEAGRSDCARHSSPTVTRNILARVNEHFDAGADHVCVQVLGADFGEAPLDGVATLAPRRFALSSGPLLFVRIDHDDAVV